MLNSIKSQRYQMRRDIFLLVGTLGAVLLPSLIAFTEVEWSNATGSDILRHYLGESSWIFLIYAIIFLIPRICGGDFSDKTLYYEILGGKKRWTCYFSRVYMALERIYMIIVIGSILPIALGIAVKGYGSSIDFGDALAKAGIALCIIFRICCEMIFITFLLQDFKTSALFGMVVELGLLMPIMVIIAFFKKLKFLSYFSGIMRLLTEMDFSNAKMGFIAGKDVYIAVVDFVNVEVWMDTVGSVCWGVLLLIIGYVLFRKRDL